MSKKDIGLLITGISSFVVAIIFAVITLIVFSVQVTGAVAKTNWNHLWNQARDNIEDIVDGK